MSYLLYKLRFPSGIHIGTAFGNTLEETMISVYSDTFYSALFNEYMKIYNAKKEDTEGIVEKILSYYIVIVYSHSN